MLAPALLLAAVLPARAGGSADALRDVLSAEAAPPELAGACAPAGAALTRAVDLLHLSGLPVTASLPGPLSAVLTLADPAAARLAGLDPDGVLAAALGPDKSSAWASVPFGGTPIQAEAFLRLLQQDPHPAEAGWALGTQGDRASLTQGSLRLEHGALSPGGVTPDLRLLQDLPSAAACTVWASVPEDALPKSLRGAGSSQVVLQVPLTSDGELLLRTRLADPAPASFARPTGAPAGGSTSEAPALVMAFGASPFTVLADPEVAKDAKISPAEIKRAQKTFNLAPGATLAIFGDPTPKNVDFVLVLPVRSPPTAMNRAKALDRRTVKLLGRLGMRATRTSATTFTVAVGDRNYFGATRAGRVIIGARPDRVTEVVNSVGRSWLEGADIDRLQNWTVAIWTGPGLNDNTKMGNVAVDLGLRSVDGAWELGMKVHGEPEGGWPAFFAAVTAGMGGIKGD